MVALAIAAGALIMLSQIASSSLHLAHQARALEQAVSRARSHLAEAVHGAVVAGQRRGDDGGGYSWRVTTRASETIGAGLKAPGPRLTLFVVTATVAWRDGRREHAVSVATQALAPAEAARP
jgi:hypothetical protein